MHKLRPRSHLVPEHGARARFSLGTNVNTPFFQVPTPEFGHGQYKVETLYSGTKVGTDILGTQCLNTAPFCAGARALVLGHQVWTWPKPKLQPNPKPKKKLKKKKKKRKEKKKKKA